MLQYLIVGILALRRLPCVIGFGADFLEGVGSGIIRRTGSMVTQRCRTLIHHGQMDIVLVCKHCLHGIISHAGLHTIPEIRGIPGEAVADHQDIQRSEFREAVHKAVATSSTGMGGIALFRVGRSSNYRCIAVAKSICVVTGIACAAGGAGVGGVTLFSTGRLRYHRTIGVSNGFCFVRYIAVTAGGAGVGGIATFGACGGRDGSRIGMVTGIFPDFQVGQLHIFQQEVGRFPHETQKNIMPVYPACRFLGLGTILRAVRRIHVTDLNTVYDQIQRIRTIRSNAVFNTIDMLLPCINAEISQLDTVISAFTADIPSDKAPGIRG